MKAINVLRGFLSESPSAVYPDEVFEYVDAIERELEEEYVPLPNDEDGVPIHIGDEMEGVNKYDSLKKAMGKVITVSFESDGITDVAIQVWGSDGKSWHRVYLDPNANIYRHYHEPTVEDVLEKALNKAAMLDREEGYWPSAADITNFVNELAPKLRLKETDNELN